MLKLKTLILEGQRPTISKMEEAYALKVISEKLLPHVAKHFNQTIGRRYNVPEMTVEQFRKSIKKVKIENYTNGQEIYYAIVLPKFEPFIVNMHIDFSIRKIAFRKNMGDASDKDVFDVAYYDWAESSRWGELAWTRYDVKTLASGEFDPEPLA